MQEDFQEIQTINNFYIKIEEQRVSHQPTIPWQVNFEFDQESLDAIAKMQVNRNSLSFDSELLTNLRYYCLLQCNNIARSGLTFTTYYCQDGQRIAVISSNISVQGQISQQIRHDFLVNFPLLEKIIDAHYWSIDQIFEKLPLMSDPGVLKDVHQEKERASLTYQKKNYLLSWILPLLITLGIAIFILLFLSSISLVKAIAIFIIFILTKFSIQYLIKKYLLKLILQQLLFGLFSHNVTRRKLAFTLLNYL